MASALFIPQQLPQVQASDYPGIIEGWGLFDEVLVCSDESSALDLLEQSPVDVVLYAWLEIESAGLYTFLQAMQKHDDWSELPVLIMAERNQLPASLAALEQGAADCLAWQLPTAECKARVRTHLKLKERIAALRNDNKRLARMALTDRLTGLHNRAYFDMMLENEITRSKRSGQPLSLLLLDLDHFKQVNDTYGHQVGDRVLEMVSSTLKLTCRRPDVVCRYGGEEFTLILPETNASAAFVLAERIRRKLMQVTCTAAGKQVKVSASIGVSCSGRQQDIDGQSLLMQADLALYAGKRNGRNRTEIHGHPQPAKGLASVFSGSGSGSGAGSGILQAGLG